MAAHKHLILVAVVALMAFLVIPVQDADAYYYRSVSDGDWFATGTGGTWEMFSGFGWSQAWRVPNYATSYYYSDRVYILNNIEVNAPNARASEILIGGVTSTNALSLQMDRSSNFQVGETARCDATGGEFQVTWASGWAQIIVTMNNPPGIALNVGDSLRGLVTGAFGIVTQIIVNTGASAVGTLHIGQYGELTVEERQVYYYNWGSGTRYEPGGDLQVISGTLWNDGLLILHGALIVGTGIYADDAQRAQEFMMTGGLLQINYGIHSRYAGMAGADISGALFFFPGTVENLIAGDIHIVGWFVGGHDAANNRIFDLTDSSCVIYLDHGLTGTSPGGQALSNGRVYPGTAYIYAMDDQVNPQPMKFGTLSVNRPGGIVEARATIEIYQNFTMIDGTFQGPSGGVNISFCGQIPGNWITVAGQYNNLIPLVSNKKGQLTLRSPTVQLPGFGVNNPDPNFSLFIDPQGARTLSMQVLDGRVWITSGTWEIEGYMQFGQSVPVLAGTFPQLDQLGTGMIWIRDDGGPFSGDFYFQQRATGNQVAGTLKLEGHCAVDSAVFMPTGTHTLEMTGTRSTNIWNNQIPPGFSVPTLVCQNFAVSKVGTAQANPISSMCVNGDLMIFSGVLNSNSAGWAITLKGQWPVNNGTFTSTTAVQIETPGMFTLPPGSGPIIRINKSDAASPDNRVQMGAALSCWGLQVWDGTFDFMGRTLTVTGNVIIGTGNQAQDQSCAPGFDMLQASGGGICIVNAQGQTDGCFIVFEHSLTDMDAGRMDIEGDIKIDSSTFLPTGSHFIRLVGNRGSEVQMWCNKGTPSSHLDLWHLMFMKDTSGPAVGAQVNLGSTVYIMGKFTMFSGSFNASIPAAPAQVLHLKGSPDAWAGMGGAYTDVHNNGSFPILIDGTGDQSCFSGDLSSTQAPDITIYKNGALETVYTLGGTLHANRMFVAKGRLQVDDGAAIADADFFVGGGSLSQDLTNRPEIHMNDLNGIVECKGDFYFMAGAIENITNGQVKAHGDFKILDYPTGGREFDLYDTPATDRAILEMTGSGSPAVIFRADHNNTAEPLNLYEWTINKSNSADLVEAYSIINVNGPFQVLNGTLSTPGGVVNIRNNWITTGGGAYDPAATLALNGNGTLQVITSNVTLPNIYIDKPGAISPTNRAVVPTGGLLSTRTFWIKQGLFCLNGGTMATHGDFVVGGVNVPAVSAATLEISATTGGGTLMVLATTSGDGNFYFNHGHNEAVLIDAGRISVEGTFGIADEPLPNPPNFTTTGTNVVELSGNRGTPTSIWSTSGQLTLAELVVIKTGTIPGNQVDMISNLIIAEDFAVVQGMFNTNNFTAMQVGGDWTVSSGCYFMPTVCRVTLTGTDGVPVAISNESANAGFYDLVVDLPNPTDVCQYSSATGRSLNVNNTLWVNSGDMDVPAGVDLNVGTAASGNSYLILGDANQPTAGGTLRIGGGTTVTLGRGTVVSVESNASLPSSPTGSLYLSGTPTQPVRFTTPVPGVDRFGMLVSGRLQAQYYDMESMDQFGIQFGAASILNAPTNNLSYGSFDYPSNSGVFMDFSLVPNTTGIPQSIRYCTFDNTNGASGATNVKGSGSWSVTTDVIYFLSASGALAGETFDDDPQDGTNEGCIKWSVGTINVSLGADDPGTSSRLTTQTNVVAMQLHLHETSGKETVNLNQLILSEGGPTTNISGVALWLDNDSDGAIGGSDVQIGTTQTFGGGQATFSGLPLIGLPANGQLDILVVYNFTGAAGLPWTYQPYVSANTDLTGIAVLTNLPAEITGAFPLYGGVMTVDDRGTLSVEAGVNNPPAGMIVRGMLDAPMQQIRLSAGQAEDTRIGSFTVHLSLLGTGALETELSSVRLIKDLNGDGFYQPGSDTQIGTAQSWSGGTVTFSGAPLMTLLAGEVADFLVVCNVSSSVSGSEAFRTYVQASTSVTVTGATSLLTITPTGSFPLNGNRMDVTLEPTVFAIRGANNPPSRGVDKGGLAQAMMQIRVVALGDALDVEMVRFQNQGTIDPSAAISNATLVLDANGNGGWDTGETVLGTVSSVGTFVQFTWSGASRPQLQNNLPQHWLLCYDFNGQGVNGQTLMVSLPVGGMTAKWATTDVSVNGLPFDGGQVTLLDGVGSVTVDLGPISPLAGYYSSTAAKKVMVQYRLTAGPHEPVRLDTLTIFGSGTGDEFADVASVELYDDADHDGKHSTFDTLLGNGTYSADDGTVTFSSSPLITIQASAYADIIVVYTFNGASSHDETFAVRIESAVDVSASGELSFASITAGGTFPLAGNEMRIVVPGTMSISAGPRNPLATFEMLQSQDLAMVQLALAANDNEDLQLTRLQVEADGTANDSLDLATGSVRLYRDVDRNGLLSGPDELIEPKRYDKFQSHGQYPASWGTFAADNGTLVFEHLDEVVSAGTTQYWLVVVDIGNTAMLGSTFRVSIPANTDIEVVGLKSGDPALVQGAPITGGMKTIGVTGSLSLFPGLNSPPSRNESATAANVEVVQFALAASTVEDVNVRSVMVSAFPSGNADDSTAVSAVYLYRDAHGNGVLDPVVGGTGYQDLPLGQGTYSADNGTVIFGLATAEFIAKNTEQSYLVVYDLSGTATTGQSFVAGVAQNSDIVAEGSQSLSAIQLSGAPLQGAAMMVGTVGSVMVSYGPQNPAPRYVSGPESDVAVLHVALKATSIEGVQVDSLTIHAGGTADDMTVTATLWEDTDGDGIGDTILGTPGRTYTADNGTVTFTGLALVVPSSQTRYMVLTYTFSFDPALCWGQTYETRMIPTLDMQCSGSGTGNTLYAAGTMLFSSRFKVGVDPTQVKYLSLPKGSSGGGCFVATASFGSLDEAPVTSLCGLRDEVLSRNGLGRAFVSAYYRVSPPAADAIRDNTTAKTAARTALAPLVGLAKLAVDASAATQVLFGLIFLAFAGLVLGLGRRCLRKTA